MALLLLILGFVLLIIGADKLVEGSSGLAKNLKIPNIVIGLTVVAFGTSAPELVVNAFSSYNGHTDLVMGNVLGSNIFNIAAILGASALFKLLIVKRNTTWLEIPFNLLAISVACILALDFLIGSGTDNSITRADGLILLAFFVIFIIYNIELAIKGSEEFDDIEESMTNLKAMLFFVGGMAGLVIGGKLIVDNAVEIAIDMGISERVIGLTIVSIGTSLPELAASIVAVRKGKVDIAVGNVIGSNIFNICLVLGVSGVINTIHVPDASFFDIYFNILLGILLFAFVFIGKARSIQRYEGLAFVLIYVAYIVHLVLGV
jgi:cation:H+ antiporter